MDPRIIEIPAPLISEWDNITKLIGELCQVPACLVMNCYGTTIEVMATTESPDNPYHHGDYEHMLGKLYCETVMKQQAPLHVPDATADPDWQDNPDIKLGMIMYYGVPINWPDGQPFGTLCILDRQRKVANPFEQRLIRHFANLIEANLAMLVKNHELEHAAGHDDLTELLNRRMLHEILAKQIANSQRLGTGLSLIYLDLDNFKAINDRYGHEQGDQVLVAVAEIIRTQLRRGDYAFRYGGEEFIITMLDVDIDEAAAIAERLRLGFGDVAGQLGLNEVVTTCSLGVTVLQDEDSQYTLLGRADRLMYQAKQRGKNQVVTDTDQEQDCLSQLA